jgi:SAM-dependent methyltransferase
MAPQPIRATIGSSRSRPGPALSDGGFRRGAIALSFYQRRILPHLIHRGMRHRRFLPLREQLVEAARGRVLEIGVGSGLNLPLYRRDLEQLTGLDPSPELLARARRSAAWVHFPVRLVEGRAEELPLEDATVDCVVTSWTLCSVADPGQALAEVRRVLRPGGAFLFVEHGRADDAGVRRWQDRLTPLWCRIAGGCHLNRPMAELIEAAGLDLVELETGYPIRGPRFVTFHYRGRATR